MLKVCTNPDCALTGELQPFENFGKDRHQKDGLTFQCKVCRRQAATAYRAENPGIHRNRTATWRANNPEKARATAVAAQQQRLLDPKRFQKRLVWKYKISEELADQIASGLVSCEVCQSTEKIVVDHCHKTGQFRGVLCHKCNVVLGFAEDNAPRLAGLITYLESFKGKQSGRTNCE